MKIMTILGTRPEIIRLCRVIPILKERFDHVLVHTGQNYDYRLNEIFFQELGVQSPDIFLEVKENHFSTQIGKILSGCEQAILREKPDAILILGDTNSGLAAFVAKRMGIPVFHMEAGNRCYDDRVPEEVNRRVIDHSSDILMPYTERSKENLLREGIDRTRIYVTGNPINEVIETYTEEIRRSHILKDMDLHIRDYFLATAHRAENVDNYERLYQILCGLKKVQEETNKKFIFSVHPRTKSKIEQFDFGLNFDDIIFAEPFGFFDFVKLERDAMCVISDSGTVQEECCIMGVPNVTIRDVTERPETIECGSNILVGCQAENIKKGVNTALQNGRWTPPSEYVEKNVAVKISNIIMSEMQKRGKK